MKITVITVGKLKEKFWKDACAEYLKRLQRYAKVNVVEVNDSNIEDEAITINKKLDKLDGYIIPLCIEGKELDSEELANKIDKLTLSGISHIIFIVGGSDGIDKSIKTKSDFKLSFGKITLPHNLARVVLLEQIYRCFKIINGETYHK